MKPENLDRLASALTELAGEAVSIDLKPLEKGAAARVATAVGEILLTVEPSGSRGYDDLRRRASREPIGQGVRPNVASLGDLIRIADASHDPALEQRAQILRRVADIGVDLGIQL
jgi:hypothetical protein